MTGLGTKSVQVPLMFLRDILAAWQLPSWVQDFLPQHQQQQRCQQAAHNSGATVLQDNDSDKEGRENPTFFFLQRKKEKINLLIDGPCEFIHNAT